MELVAMMTVMLRKRSTTPGRRGVGVKHEMTTRPSQPHGIQQREECLCGHEA